MAKAILLIERLTDERLDHGLTAHVNSLAPRSSSASMPDARSTFTLRIGPGTIMCPVLVKQRDTSFPW